MTGRRTRVACACAAVLAAALAVRLGSSLEIPSAREVRASHRPSDARLLDRDGAVLHEVRIDEERRALEWTPLERISPALVAAVLYSEDRRFPSHHGVDARAIGAAALGRVTGERRRGASTITMQLAALLDPSLAPGKGGRTIGQKARQIVAALALEQSWSKKEILEAYLNLVPMRGDVVGITAAASALLGKDPHGVSHAEALVLASLLRSPGTTRERALERSAALAAAMHEPVERAALEEATARALGAPTRRGPRPREAPHLAQRILRERRAGDVRTTLSRALQRRATALLERELLSERGRNVRDGAAVVVENATGDVLAWVGGSGRLASARHVDGVLARRQIGSTVKPFLYALALDRRVLTAASLLDDTPVEIPVASGVYRPRNYDHEFRGAVSLRTALASSLNVPAVRTQELLGEPALVSRLVALDFAGVVASGDHYGPSLALGSADVSLLELVNAYRTLANGGVWRPLRLLPDEGSYEGRRVFSEAASFVVSDILSDRESRSTTFGLENPLATRFWSAVKTGTSKDMRDNWCIGYSRDYTVGVWVGNFSGEPMHDVSRVTGAAPIWLEILSLLHAERPSPPPEPPQGVVARTVSFDAAREPARTEWFLEGTEPAGARIEAAPARARIVAPTEGAVLALDPDVPPALQRVALVASKGEERLEWRLDGRPLAPARDPFLWRPEPGRHELALVDRSGLVRDRIAFAVRE